ncbi:hypothetical protein ACLOJK_013922 [Asimina triloba]
MVRASLPPGFRFHPTDDELVTYYLKRKVTGKRLRSEAISEIEIYKFAPWDLPGKACLQSDDLEWFFFCALDRKYANGRRANRSTDMGYWKTTGKDRIVYHNSRIVGMKKTLVFHKGRAPRGDRTNWVMYEYRLEDQTLADAGVMQDAFVLCKIFEKSGPGPKNGEERGAPFREEDWEDDDAETNSSLLLPLIGSSSLSSGSANITATNCRYNTHTQSGDLLQPLPQSHPVVCEEDPLMQECVNVDELLAALSDNDDDALASNENCCGEEPEPAIPTKDTFNNDEIFDDLGDIVNHTELYLSTNFSGEDVSNPMHLDGYYLELDDLRLPEFGICDSAAPLKAANISNHMVDDPISSVGNQAAAHDLDVPAVQVVSEVANDFVPQTLLAGEQHEFPLPSTHVSNGGLLYSELQHLLASIPAKPASAAEFPCLVGGNHFKGSNPYCQSPFHVDAEVAVANVCSVDVVRTVGGEVEHATCMVYHGGKVSRKCGEHSSLSGGGFMFVFLLGVMSAFVWIVLLAVSAKLGRYAWKHFLAW